MDVVYATGRATAAEIRERLPSPPTYSAVRALLRILEEKGHLTHQHDGPRYVYEPVVPVEQASTSALRHLISTFFEGSREQAVAALLELDGEIDSDEAKRLRQLIDAARREGR